MGLVHLLLAAQAIEAGRKKTGAYQADSPKSYAKNSSDSDNGLDAYYNNSMDMENFLEAVLLKDSEATEVFLSLSKSKDEIEREDYQGFLEIVQNVCIEYEGQEKLLKTEEQNLVSVGIHLDSSSVLREGYRSVRVDEGNGYGNYGSYDCEGADYKMGFNGMPLTREMVEKGINQFQIDLDAFNSENPDIDDRLTEIKTKIAKQKKKIKYSLFNREKKQSLLTEMLKIENEIKKKINSRDILEKRSIDFMALTDEQKKSIISYMDQVSDCIKIGKKLSRAMDDSRDCKYNYKNSREKRNVHQRMLERAAIKCGLTIEEIEFIIERTKAIMDKNYFNGIRFKRISRRPYHYPTSPESMFAAQYYEEFYGKYEKNGIKVRLSTKK